MSSPTCDDRPTIPLTMVGAYGRNTALLGVQLGGSHQLWDRQHAPFLLVSGQTGSGKSVCIRCVEVHDLKVGNIGISLEQKPDDVWADGAISRAITPQGWLRGLRWGVSQIDERVGICEAAKVPAIHMVDPDTPWITYYIHEFPGLVGEEALLDLKPEEREEAVRLVTRIVKVGRALRVSIVAGTQDPTLYGTFGKHKSGGAIRRNFVGRAHFDADSDSMIAAFDGMITRQTDRLLQTPHKGRCGALFLHPNDGDRAVAAQIWHITPELARPFAAAYEGPEPIDFDSATRTREFHP